MPEPCQRVDGRAQSLPSSAGTGMAIAGLLTLALVVRLALLVGPTGSDDVNYFHFAQKLLRGEPFTELHHHGGRLVFLLLIGVPAAWFDSIHAGAIVNVFALLVRDLCIALYLRYRFGPAACLCGVAVLCVNPLSTAYAGVMLPDGALSFAMFACAVAAFEAAASRGRRRIVLIVVGGLCAGAAYSMKDTGILIVPCAALWLLFRGWREHKLQALLQSGLFVLAFAAFAGLEVAAYFVLSGDALYRFHAISLTHNTIGDVVEARSFSDFARSTYWNLRAMTRITAGSGALIAFAVAIWIACFVLRTGGRFFAAIGLFLTAYLIFGSSSFTRLIPLPVQDRYFEILAPFTALAAAALVEAVAQRTGPLQHRTGALAATMAVVLALLSVPGVVVNAGDVTFAALGRNAAIAIHAVRRADPDAVLFASPTVRPLIEPFVSTATFRSLKNIPTDGSLAQGYYLTHPWKDKPAVYPPAATIEALPAHITVDEDHRIFGRWIAPLDRRFTLRLKR